MSFSLRTLRRGWVVGVGTGADADVDGDGDGDGDAIGDGAEIDGTNDGRVLLLVNVEYEQKRERASWMNMIWNRIPFTGVPL